MGWWWWWEEDGTGRDGGEVGGGWQIKKGCNVGHLKGVGHVGHLKVVEDEETLSRRLGNIVCKKSHDAKHGKTAVLDLLRELLGLHLCI